MIICQVLAGNEEGGLEKHVAELCNRLINFHEIHIIAHEKYKNRLDSKINFHALDLSKGRRNIFILYRLCRTIARIQPDILHAHANKAADMISYIRRFLPASTKTVATLHSEKREIKSFETFDHVIGVSQKVLEKLKNPHHTVIYNGISFVQKTKDTTFLSQFGIKDEFTICAIGRLERIKNFPLLIRAIKHVNAKLLIIGEGGEERKLKSLVQDLCLQNKVIFTGYRHDVQEILTNANLCVITSDREGFPYILIEALLANTPVVSTNVSDMKMILPANCILPVNDEKGLTEKLLMAQRDYTDLVHSFTGSFKFAKDHFTLDAMIENILLVYRDVLSAQNPATKIGVHENQCSPLCGGR